MDTSTLIGRVFGISLTSGGRQENDQTTLEYAKLIEKTKLEVCITSGKLMRSVYLSKNFLNAISTAKGRGAKIHITTGPKANKEDIQEFRAMGIDVQVLNNWPDRHFAVVDGKHVRLEEPHPESNNECTQYIIYNYEHASSLRDYFFSMYAGHSKGTHDGIL